MSADDGRDEYNLWGEGDERIPYTVDRRRLREAVLDRIRTAKFAVDFMARDTKFAEEHVRRLVTWATAFLCSVPLTLLWMAGLASFVAVALSIKGWIVVAWAVFMLLVAPGLFVVNFVRFAYDAPLESSATLARRAVGSACQHVVIAHLVLWFFPFVSFPFFAAMIWYSGRAAVAVADGGESVKQRKVADDVRMKSAMLLHAQLHALNTLALRLYDEERTSTDMRDDAAISLMRIKLQALRERVFENVAFLERTMHSGKPGSFLGDTTEIARQSLEDVREAERLVAEGKATQRTNLELFRLETLGKK